MKRKLLVASVFIFSLAPLVKAQEVMDAYKLTQTELTGTARSMSMGGAFGALGGDISGIAINPAGIGVYKSSEIVATLNFQNMENKTTTSMASMKEDKFKVNFNNFAFVGTFPLYNDVAPLFNVGFSYNRLKSFDRKYKMQAGGGGSMTDYLGVRATETNLNKNDLLSGLAFESYLITEKNGGGYRSSLPGIYVDNDLYIKEIGSVNSYDFNFGTTFSDVLSVGMTLSVTDIDYRMYSQYTEYFSPDNTNEFGGFDLKNDLKTEGTGWKLGLGVIFKPIQELRIGLAYHSPTWYNMSDYYGADLTHDFEPIIDHLAIPDAEKGSYQWGEESTGEEWLRTDYKLRTPDKWVFSVAGVLGKNAIISLDYELVDYGKTKFDERHNGYAFDEINADVKKAYKLASTLRIGGEYRFTSQFSGRVGYSWQQNPYESKFNDRLKDKNLNDVIYTAGTTPHYIAYGDTHYITWGLGYKLTKNFYTDLGFVYKTQESDLYAYSKSDITSVKETSIQGVLTLGFRF